MTSGTRLPCVASVVHEIGCDAGKPVAKIAGPSSPPRPNTIRMSLPAFTLLSFGGAPTPPKKPDQTIGGGGATLKLAEVTLTGPVDGAAEKTSVCAPEPVTTRSVNFAVPCTALTVSVPLSAPLPVAIATVTASVARESF